MQHLLPKAGPTVLLWEELLLLQKLDISRHILLTARQTRDDLSDMVMSIVIFG